MRIYAKSLTKNIKLLFMLKTVSKTLNFIMRYKLCQVCYICTCAKNRVKVEKLVYVLKPCQRY